MFILGFSDKWLIIQKLIIILELPKKPHLLMVRATAINPKNLQPP